MPHLTKGGLQPTHQPNLVLAFSNEILTQYIIHLQKKAYSEQTVKTKYKILRVMLKDHVDLSDIETVKLYIARKQTWSTTKTALHQV
jgi:hypothetical protein